MSRRRMMNERNNKMIEPFYSDFPELTETGLYILTPQTEETTNTNIYIEIGENAYRWVASEQFCTPITIFINDDASRAFFYDIRDTGIARLQSIKGESGKKTIKLKRCAGKEDSPALVTFYVEQIL